MFYSIDDAIDLMETTISDRTSTHNGLSYFFIVGAGVSTPEIPTSGIITDQCIQKIKERYKDEELRFQQIQKKPPQMIQWIDILTGLRRLSQTAKTGVIISGN